MDHFSVFPKKRYNNPSILVYTDANQDLRILSQFSTKLLQENFHIIHDNDPTRYTRIDQNSQKTSYLDFFITSNLKTKDFQIQNQRGRSDHLFLSIVIEQIRLLYVKKIK